MRSTAVLAGFVALFVHALATLTLPNGTIIERGRHFDFEDSSTKFGDPVLNALIGLPPRNFCGAIHSAIGKLNGWPIDAARAAEKREARRHRDLVSALGIEVGCRHLPVTSISAARLRFPDRRNVSKTFAFGISGYHYQQITGDSGAGAKLGGFEGRVTGLGPDVTYTFMCGKIPVSTELKYFREFDVENRLTGDAGLLTISMPLSVGP